MKNKPETSYKDYFPLEKMRSIQEDILDCLDKIDNIKDENGNQKYRFIVIEAGTGVGKSAIAKAIATKEKGAYVLTATKSLQKQYINDFGNQSTSLIMGRSNYRCVADSDYNCDNAPCRAYRQYELEHNCDKKCKYKLALNKAKQSNLFVTSYAYFFSCDSSVTGRKNLPPRNVLILDECHMLEEQLLNHVDISVHRQIMENQYELIELINNKQWGHRALNYFNNNDLTIMAAWMQDFSEYKTNKEFLIVLLSLLEERINVWREENNTAKFGKINEITGLNENILAYLEDIDKDENNINKWIISVLQDGFNEVLHIQPLNINSLFFDKLNKYAKKYVILMSATILNNVEFCTNLGLKPHNTAFISADSTFDTNRSPVIFDPVGSMAYKDLDNTLPKLVDNVNSIMELYKDYKGVIHTGNYKIAKYLVDHLDNKRVTANINKKISNEKLLERHRKKKNSVLISPAVTTGESFNDDDCRFQIIVKLPYASLADKRVKIKMQKNPVWYTMNMIKTLIQSSGRATRSDKDWSATYILDSCFEKILKYNNNLLTDNFKKRMVNKNNFNEENFISHMEY